MPSRSRPHQQTYESPEYKEAFALFDKKGTGAVPREVLGDLLRALGQNPTQAEVADIVAGAPRDGALFWNKSLSLLDFEFSFLRFIRLHFLFR